MRESGAKGKLTAKSESKKLIGGYGSREAAIICNNGSNDVWLGCGEAAVAEEGIYLKKEGGAIVVDFFNGEITAITKTGESVVTYQQV